MPRYFVREIGRLYLVIERLDDEEAVVFTSTCAREARDEARRYRREV